MKGYSMLFQGFTVPNAHNTNNNSCWTLLYYDTGAVSAAAAAEDGIPRLVSQSSTGTWRSDHKG